MFDNWHVFFVCSMQSNGGSNGAGSLDSLIFFIKEMLPNQLNKIID